MALSIELNSNRLNNRHLKRIGIKERGWADYHSSVSASGYDAGVYKSANVSGAVFKGETCKNILNNQINTTTNSQISGRVSFKGDAAQAASSKFIDAIVKHKFFKGFCDLAQKNSAVAEAVGALFITCGMRPLAIMAMPQEDVDKNRKAASHSIASGVTGLVFAKIAYEPFSAAMKKIQDAIAKGHPEQYFGDKAKYILKEGVERTKNGMTKHVSNMDCFNQLVTYGPKVVTAPVLAALTVGTMPYIDKYIIDKYILRKPEDKDEKPVFTTYDHFKFITFKSKQNNKQVFQNFKGALK